MSKRAVLYARVSGDDRHKEGRNLAGQIAIGREYAQERGYRIVGELPEDDRGASGASFELPMLNQALEMARGGEFDVFVVRELDRLSRNLAKQLIVEQELKRAGVSIEYVLGEYPDTPEGRLNKHVRAVIAEFEREKITQRMTRAKHWIVKSGRVILHGNKVAYGYRYDAESRMLVIYEPEARIVRLIFDWYVNGDEQGNRLSIRAIAERLTTMGAPTWADIHGGPKKRGYGQWEPVSVSNILNNETYAGTWYYGKKTNDREHWLAVEVPSIVSRETWEKAQARRVHNREQAKRNTKHEYLLGRRVTCGSCGSGMSGRRSGHHTYHYCRGGDRIVNIDCDMPYFRSDHVGAAVWGWIKGLLMNPEALRQDLEEQQAEQGRANKPLHDRLTVVDDLLANHQRQLERLLDLYLSGDFDKEILTERKTRLETTIVALEKERADLLMTLEAQTLSDEQVTTITDFAKEVSGGLEIADQDFDARRQIIDLLDVRVTLAIEEGQKIAYVHCLVGKEETLSIEPSTSRKVKGLLWERCDGQCNL